MKNFLQYLVPLKRDDWVKAIPLSCFFFLVIITYWILKPIKRGVIINYFGNAPLKFWGLSLNGAQAEQIGKVLDVFAAYFLVILFTWLVKKIPRHHVILVFGLLFSAAFVLFSRLLQDLTAPTVFSFYVVGDMFNTTMVAAFWAFCNDIVQPMEAKRCYGIVGLGGVLGGFVGATIVERHVQDVGRAPLVLLCVPVVAAMVLLAFFIHNLVKKGKKDDGPAATPNPKSELWEGARMVLKSRYLQGIAALVIIYEVVSNLIDFQLASTVEFSIPQDLKKDAFFGMVGQITGIVSIVVQLLVTGWLLRRFALKISLLFLPITIFLSSLGFLLLPVLAFAAAMSVSDNALNYSINQSARETLYTPTPTDVVYKAKPFIDMFIQRFAKVLSVVLNLGFVLFVEKNVRWLSLVTLALVFSWFGITRYVGKVFRKKALQVDAEARAEVAAPG